MNYSKEEKEAFEYLDMMENKINFDLLGYVYGNEAIDTVLNLIQKQSKIIDKTCDLYYEYLSIRPASGMKFLKSKGFDVSKCEKCSFDDDNINCKECIKEYFKKVVDEDVKD